MNQYSQFFDDLWSSDTPRYATIDGVQVRVLVGRTSNEYANNHGISLNSGSLNITLVKSELPQGWRYDRPTARLTINGKTYQTHQDIPPQSLDPDETLIKLTVHPA